MKEEKYQAKCPGHVMIADVSYLERSRKDGKEYEVIDYQPPPEFQMGILLGELRHPSEENCIRYAVNLYFAPEQYLETCMNHGTLPCQGFSQKWADTENACYKVTVDGRQETVKTESDGIWSQFQEVYSYEGEIQKAEAVLIILVMPDDETFGRMRKLVHSLFEDIQPVPVEQNRFAKEETDGVGRTTGKLTIRETIRELRNTGNVEKAQRDEAVESDAEKKKQKRKKCQTQNPER